MMAWLDGAEPDGTVYELDLDEDDVEIWCPDDVADYMDYG